MNWRFQPNNKIPARINLKEEELGSWLGRGYLGCLFHHGANTGQRAPCGGGLQQFLNTRNRECSAKAELTKAPEVHTPMAQFLQPGPTFKMLHNFPQNAIGCRQSIQNQETVGRTLYVNHEHLWYWMTHH